MEPDYSMSRSFLGRKKLRDYLFLIFFVIVTVPLSILSIFHAYSYSATYQHQAAGRIQEAATGIGEGVDDYIQNHHSALIFTAAQISRGEDLSPRGIEQWLMQTGASYKGLFTLIAADESGRVIAQKPLDPEIDQAWGTSPPPLGRSVADRQYFQQVMRTRQPFISDAFRGRGFGKAPIVALSAPVVSRDGRLIVIEGSLDLERFRILDQRYDTIAESPVVITDKKHQVVYATPGFGLEPLDLLPPGLQAVMSHHNGEPYRYRKDARGEEFIIGHAMAPRSGWHIYVGQPERLAFREVRRYYLLSAALGVAGVLLSLILATAIAGSVTAPMERLVVALENFAKGNPQAPVQVSRHAPREVAQLVESFGEMSDRLSKVLSGLLPICAWCKKIRDEGNYWEMLETYIAKRLDVRFSHGVCPDCREKFLLPQIEKVRREAGSR